MLFLVGFLVFSRRKIKEIYREIYREIAIFTGKRCTGQDTAKAGFQTQSTQKKLEDQINFLKVQRTSLRFLKANFSAV